MAESRKKDVKMDPIQQSVEQVAWLKFEHPEGCVGCFEALLAGFIVYPLWRKLASRAACWRLPCLGQFLGCHQETAALASRADSTEGACGEQARPVAKVLDTSREQQIVPKLMRATATKLAMVG